MVTGELVDVNTLSNQDLALALVSEDTMDLEPYFDATHAEEKVKSFEEYIGDALHWLYPAHEEEMGMRLPFAGSRVFFRPGEVTLWAGYNGSGKSLLQGQVMGLLAEQGQRCCIASFEMKPAVTVARLSRQMLRTGKPTKEQMESWAKNLKGQVLIYDQQGTVETKRLIAVIKYCVDHYQVQHFAIDSLMKCVKGEDDYNGQKDFVDELTAIARNYNIHIHLVHHLRKGESEGRVPGKMDIKGTGSITDQVDNVLILWRNKKKEREREEGVESSDIDALLICDKQRNGDWEGQIGLYYSTVSQRYMDEVGIL